MTTNYKNSSSNQENKIILTLLNGTGYIFEVEDYLTIRKQHHIVGALVGTCANRGWSANDCTMPVQLTTLETRLLLEQGIAVLVSKQQALLKSLNDSDIKDYQERFDLRINQQAESLKNEKIKESERNIDKIMLGKRKKLLKQGVKEEDINLNSQEILKEIRNSLTFDRKNALLDIPCAHVEPHVGQIVEFAETDRSLKYLVLRDYWLKGKYVTCGDAFGADFLIYPGDPLLYHASHIVILLNSSKVKPLDFITKVRLSVTVNKLCVFAYLAEQENEFDEAKVVYQTFVWDGNHNKSH